MAAEFQDIAQVGHCEGASMIAHDQPQLPSTVIAAVSSRDDGTMLDRTLGDRHEASIVENRRRFCEQAGVDYDTSVYQIITYSPARTYDDIRYVSKPNQLGDEADVLYTETRGLGLFLPVADCVATVIYDPKRHALALAHLGRHASVAETMTKTIDYFTEKGSRAEDLVIWMAPSVGRDHYRMAYFDDKDSPNWQGFATEHHDGIYLDLKGFNRALAIKKGVRPDHITVSPVDTAADDHYFSHSQGDQAGRFAVVAQLG